MRSFLISKHILNILIRALAASVLAIAIVLASAIHAQAWGKSVYDAIHLDSQEPIRLVGYGIVVGLNGTGDSRRSRQSTKSLQKMFTNFRMNINDEEIASRNAAAVMVSATMGRHAQPGALLDAHVSSVGDAISISGGELLITKMMTEDGKKVAVASGQVTVGGYRFDDAGNYIQKNVTTSGSVIAGVKIVDAYEAYAASNTLKLVLKQPSEINAHRIAQVVDGRWGAFVLSVTPGFVELDLSQSERGKVLEGLRTAKFKEQTESVIVINERTGTVVANAFIEVKPVTIAHGDIKVVVSKDPLISQPSGNFIIGDNVRTVVVEKTTVTVEDSQSSVASFDEPVSITDVVQSLNQLRLSTRDIITIITLMKSANAIDAELKII